MDDQADALAFLAAGAGAGIAARAVVRVDTHASAVFLIGDRAFKLKRAVRYPYLDYSTLPRRRAACRTEFAINRRIAPSLYRRVRAIRRRGNGTTGFGGAGRIIDWVIEMRRFDGALLLDSLAERGGLTPPLMRALADTIAAFHARARRTRTRGGRKGIARVIDGNLDNLRAAGAALDQGAVERLAASWRNALAAAGPVLERRRRGGKVRRSHGDLHLGNICLVDGKPTLFDAIEFSAEFTQIDVLYDLAFLVMDLVHRRLGALASLVLNRYLDVTDDDGGIAALPLFLSLRAGIRALVAVAAAARQRRAADRRKQHRLAHSYLALAEALLAPAKPRLVAVGGRSGSGKSTIAQALAPDLPPPPGARVLRSDVLRKTMLHRPPEARLPASVYTRATTKRVYANLLRRAARILAAGRSVILDAAFLDAGERCAADLLATKSRVAFTGLWVEAPPQVMAARIAARRGDASDATRAVLAQQLEYDPGPIAWRRIDSGAAVPRVVAAARRVLDAAPRLTGRTRRPRMRAERQAQGRSR
jgi:uncharacterized protein